MVRIKSIGTTNDDVAEAPPDVHPTVDRILRSAGALFGSRGYHGASMADVAREAGVSKSLLHYHFDSKEHLFLELQVLVFQDLLHQVGALARGSAQSVGHFQSALRQVLDFLEQNTDMVSVLLEFRTVLHSRPEFAERIEAFHESVVQLITDGIHNTLGAVANRLVLAPDRLARLLSTLFHGLLVDLSFAPSDRARAMIHETFSDMQLLLARALMPPQLVSPIQGEQPEQPEQAEQAEQPEQARPPKHQETP